MSKTFYICEGKIGLDGICDRCYQPSQSSSGYCTRQIPKDYFKEYAQQQFATQSNILSGHQLLPHGELTNKIEVQQQLAPSSDEGWKGKFEYWLTNSMYINKTTAMNIINHVEKYFPPSGKYVNGLKKLLNMANCPDILINHPEIIEGKLPTDKDIAWAEKVVEDYLAAQPAERAAQTDVATDDDWISEKPESFKDDCILLTATWYKDYWNITMFEMIFSDGENDQGEPAYYWGIFQDGDEWGDYEDLHAALYKIVPLPKPPKQ